MGLARSEPASSCSFLAWERWFLGLIKFLPQTESNALSGGVISADTNVRQVLALITCGGKRIRLERHEKATQTVPARSVKARSRDRLRWRAQCSLPCETWRRETREPLARTESTRNSRPRRARA